MILTDEDVVELCRERLRWTDDELIRAIESAVIKKIKKQLLHEVCFKMASGSPNRQRIHDLMATWGEQ